MGAIGVSATLPDNQEHSIYKAEFPAICLYSAVKLGTNSTPVLFTKLLPTGEAIALSSLQGVFFGKGSELRAKASSGCQIEATLVSQSLKVEHQVIYPTEDSTSIPIDWIFDTSACDYCRAGTRLLRFTSPLGGQIPMGVNIGASMTSESYLKVIRWLVTPKCPPIVEGVDFETIAQIGNQGGQFELTLTETPMDVSFYVQNSNKNNAFELACFTMSDDGYRTNIDIEAFAGEEVSAYG